MIFRLQCAMKRQTTSYMKRDVTSALAATIFLISCGALLQNANAQGGHGPVFGLATPTLPKGAWNVDATLMSAAHTQRAYMARETIRFGLTEDIQLNFSLPQTIQRMATPLNSRIGTMMAGMGDVEALAMWRFHKTYPAVGQRFESTLLLSGLYPIEGERGGLNVGPGFHAAAVTGFASRSIYVWGGGGFQHYSDNEGDRPGDLGYLSAVFAWRPPVFQGDYPKPDWRIFVESVTEFVARDEVGGAEMSDSGGTRALVGPTFLGLYRAWGLGTGVLFPVYQDLNGFQDEEGPRFAVNLSYWL